jgi:hypothetical protein
LDATDFNVEVLDTADVEMEVLDTFDVEDLVSIFLLPATTGGDFNTGEETIDA